MKQLLERAQGPPETTVAELLEERKHSLMWSALLPEPVLEKDTRHSSQGASPLFLSSAPSRALSSLGADGISFRPDGQGLSNDSLLAALCSHTRMSHGSRGLLANCPSTHIDDDGPAWHLGALFLGKVFLNHYLIGPYNLVKQKPGKHSCFALTEAR